MERKSEQGTPSEGDGKAFQPALELLLDHMLDRMRWVHLFTLLPIALFFLLLGDFVPPVPLTLWVAGVLLLEAALILVTEMRLRRAIQLTAPRWLGIYGGLHLAVSLGWALGGMALFVELPAWPQALLMVVLMAVALGGLSALSWYAPLYIGGLVLMLVPPGVMLAWRPEPLLVLLGAGSLLVVPMVSMVAWREYSQRRAFIDTELDRNALQDELELHRAELARMRSRYASLRETDPLTGVMAAERWRERLQHRMHAGAEEKIALIMVDVRKFIRINQRWGKARGDQVLQVIGRRLTELFGQASVCRLSADEFVAMTTVTDRDAARDAAERTHRYLSLPIRLGIMELDLEPSIGVAIWPDHARDVQSLLEAVSLAHYHMKAHRGSTHTLYSPNQAESTRRLIDLEMGLGKAAERGELSLAYQPQVAIDTGELVGVEALLRWNSPRLGMVSPVEFIPLAEQTGQILELGRWVIDEVGRDMAHWRDTLGYNLYVAINVSAVQLRSGQLVSHLRDCLDKWGLEPRCLHVELTESAIMEDTEAAGRVIRSMRELGLHVALDDFGIGQSSLGYLKNLEIDYLKLDRSFISTVNENSKDREITRSIISLARALGMRVVAEGIETADVRDALIELGCEMGQGYYFDYPMPVAEFESRIGSAMR